MYTAENWPIACKMNFGSYAEDGTPIAEASVSEWERQVVQVAELGFKSIDPMDDWVPIAELSDERFEDFKKLLDKYDLAVPACSVGRRNIVLPDDGEKHMAFVHRFIDRAAALGSQIVNIGFQSYLTEEQKEALWFWHKVGHVDDPNLRTLAIERIRELADHAQDKGLQISLEMYEDTYVGTPDDAVAFCRDVNHPAVGINPDLGNLIRLHRPMEKYDVMHKKVLPFANYWHIKNYLRDEDPDTGAYFSAPVPLEYGVIDYRSMIRMALRLGFKGPFMTEHYGSDWLGVGAINARYIRGVLLAAKDLIKA